MPLPKRKTSKSSRNQRRSHWKLSVPNYGECPRCHAPRMPHHACPSCGYYGDRKVLEIKEEKATA